MVHLFLRSGVLAWACLVLLLPALPASGANPAPRIVVAAMVDADRDDRADAVRLTYSERVWHARDTDGRYPFRVGTYGIRAVDAARGTRTLTVQLAEGQETEVKTVLRTSKVINYT